MMHTWFIVLWLTVAPYKQVELSKEYPSKEACYADMGRVNNLFARESVEALQCLRN